MKMNVSMKRVLSFLIAFVMVLTLAPVPVHAAEAVTMTGGEVLYLKPNSNWLVDNPRFAAYFFGDDFTWVDMEPVPDNEGYYQVTVPTGSWTNVIFCRMNPNDSTNSGDTRWNQTGDLTYDGVNNLFTVPEDYWDGATTDWSQWEPAVKEIAAEITGMSLYVDGTTYTEGETIFTADSDVIMTLTGTNFANLSENNCVQLDSDGYYVSAIIASNGWVIDTDTNTATIDLQNFYGVEYTFTSTKDYELRYSNDGMDTWIGSGIYITYDDGTLNREPAEITGMSITIDGVVYDNSNTSSANPAVITPDSTVVINAHGSNLFEDNLTEDFCCFFSAKVGDRLNSGWWTFSTDGLSASMEAMISYFSSTTTAYEMKYSNDGSSASVLVGSGVYVIYRDNSPSESAEITGMSLNVDGITYTEGDVIVTADSKVTMTVTGTNFANLSENNCVQLDSDGYYVSEIIADNGWVIDTDTNTATIDLQMCYGVEYTFMLTKDYEIRYSNDGEVTWIGSGIYITYDDGIGPAEITGVSITIDGVVYDSSNTSSANPAVITPDSTVVITAHGTNLFKDNVTVNNFCVFSVGYGDVLNSGWWTFSADGLSASMEAMISYFLDTTTAYEMKYSNAGRGADDRVGSGVYIIYQNNSTSESAEITGMSITIDGVVYDNTNTSATNPAVITPDSTVVITAHGTNLFEDTVSANHYCMYCSGLSDFLNSGWWTFSADGSSASYEALSEEFENTTTAYELKYSNSGREADGRVDSGVYIIYRETVEVPEEPEPDVETRTIYFDNTEGWDAVNAYYWADDGMVTWPGEAMTLVAGSIWSIEIPENAVYIIFNNGSTQTGDLTIPAECDNCYTFSTGDWSAYSESGEDVHSYDETTLLCSCGAASPDAVAVLSKDGTNTKAYTDLQTALNDGGRCTAEDKAVMKLLKSVDLGDTNLRLDGGAYTLDLNGFTITSTKLSQGALYLNAVSDLIIRNGTIDGNNSCIQMISGKLTLIDLTLTDADAGISASSGEAILRQCEIQAKSSGIRAFGGNIAVYDCVIDSSNYEIDYLKGTVTLHEGTAFPGGILVCDVSLDAILAEGMAYWQGNTMIALKENDNEISGGDVTIKTVCTHENGEISCTSQDVYSHYSSYSCCGTVIDTESHEIGENGICTVCGFDATSLITIKMTDDYGDGWNGSAIRVYEDGILVATATFDDGSTGTWKGIYDPEKEYEFYWVQGSCSGECSFEILILEETVFTASMDDCFLYPDNYRVFPVCEHVYDEGVVTDPTCMQQGYTTYTCTLCGLFYWDDYLDSLGGHTKPEGDEGVVTDPTCENSGYTTYTCGVCGEDFKTDYVEPLGHNLDEDDEGFVTDPTCNSRGYTTYTCTNCGESFEADYVDALGHTLSEDGTCSVCGELYSVPVWVAGYQIDSLNMGDILGDGTASYDPATNTLTLNGYQNEHIVAEIPLNIVLLGENRIEGSDYGFGFDICGGEINIGGTGSLEIVSIYESIYVYGSGNTALTIGGSVTINLVSDYEGIYLYAGTAALVIKDSARVIAGTESAPVGEECYYVYGENSGSVTITGSASVTGVNNDEEGIYVSGNTSNITISGNATVHVVGTEEGLDAETITITGGTVTAIGGVDYDGIYAEDLTISGGTVTAAGDSHGIEANNITITGGTVTVTGGGMIATAYYVEGELNDGTITLGEGMTFTAPEGAALGELDLTEENEGPVVTVLNSDGTMADTFTISAANVPVRITQQPTDAEGLLNENAVFTVVAQGEGLTYQWYYYNVIESAWLKSYTPGSTTDTLQVQFLPHRNGQQYRCEVTDANGNTAITDIVTMTLSNGIIIISDQPESVEEGILYETYTFTVAADGNNLTYLWEVSTDGGSTWEQSWLDGYNTDTLTVTLSAYRNGHQYRCIISNTGYSVTSEPAKLILQEASVEILTQPEDVKVLSGEAAVLQVEAIGTNLTFAWYYSTDNGATWNLIEDTNTDTLMIEAGVHTQGRFRCKITDGSGKSVWSNPARLMLKAEIVTQPTSQACEIGETVTFTVHARGENLRYRWYRSLDEGMSWEQSWLGGYNTDTLSFAFMAGRCAMYRCEITDSQGETVTTEAVTLSPKVVELAILTQPENMTIALNDTVTFTVEAQGIGLTYRWYYSADGGNTWDQSWLDGYNTDTLSFIGIAARVANQYKCIITDAKGNKVETNAVHASLG